MIGPRASVVICTYNRRPRLETALAALDRLEDPGVPYELVVVDNGSTDDTPGWLAAWAAAAPAGGPARRVLTEPRSGKSFALNLAVAATTSEWLALTDDDVLVAPDWLRVIVQGFRDDPGVDYLGGKVLPLWEAPPPPWFSMRERELFGTIAILDYGDEPFVFRGLVPLGANIAYRRRAFERVGLFRTDLGRDHTTLRGQEFPEHLLRLTRAGGYGRYLPTMVVHHHVPAWRLTKRYFREWFYWKGISRALLAAATPVDEQGLDYRTVPRLAGIPRFMYRQAVETAAALLIRALRGDRAGAFVRELRLWYLYGFARQALRQRRAAGGPAGAVWTASDA
ncbi:MAG TPA: glycosyltransferase [Thermodesulfobacteriota bacterium]|nr:glycosyltransferase [Thermodesulfobacteriota bacterium]